MAVKPRTVGKGEEQPQVFAAPRKALGTKPMEMDKPTRQVDFNQQQEAGDNARQQRHPTAHAAEAQPEFSALKQMLLRLQEMQFQTR